ncbi:MAG: hypothetical protein ACKO5F_16380 [Synechococcus sp.]
MHAELVGFDEREGKELPLEAYIAGLVELTDRCFRDHPGYPAIFMDVQAATRDLIASEEEADARLIAALSATLLVHAAADDRLLGEQESRLIAYVLLKAIGNLLWISTTQEPEFRDRLVRETSELAIAYLRRRIAASSSVCDPFDP